jgi:antiviral helicase SLH1
MPSEGRSAILEAMRITDGSQGGTDTSHGKVNILLQAHISHKAVEDFALVSDTAYVVQNGGRIMRALFEIALSKKWASVSSVLLGMSKAIERGMWQYEHPLKQFSLKDEVARKLDEWAGDWSVSDLADSDPQMVGELVHLNARHGAAIITAAKQFPLIKLQFDLRPLGSDILKISITAHREFLWNANRHGSSQMFLLWLEDNDASTILQSTYLVFRPTTELIKTSFIVAIGHADTLPSLTARSMSDHWIGADEDIPIPVESIIMPRLSETHTRKLDLPLLPVSILKNPVLEGIFSHISYLNSIQSQVYWSLVHNQQHSILCSPAGSGKSTIAQIVLWYV